MKALSLRMPAVVGDSRYLALVVLSIIRTADLGRGSTQTVEFRAAAIAPVP